LIRLENFVKQHAEIFAEHILPKYQNRPPYGPLVSLLEISYSKNKDFLLGYHQIGLILSSKMAKDTTRVGKNSES